MLRVDSLAADHQPDKTVVSIEGLKGLFIVQGAPFSCAKSFEIKVISISYTFLKCLIVQHFSVEFQREERKP